MSTISGVSFLKALLQKGQDFDRVIWLKLWCEIAAIHKTWKVQGITQPKKTKLVTRLETADQSSKQTNNVA